MDIFTISIIFFYYNNRGGYIISKHFKDYYLEYVRYSAMLNHLRKNNRDIDEMNKIVDKMEVLRNKIIEELKNDFL